MLHAIEAQVLHKELLELLPQWTWHTALTLRYEGYTQLEISRIMGRNKNTVESYLAKGYRYLRQRYQAIPK